MLYSRIAITLWQSSRQLDYAIPMQNVSNAIERDMSCQQVAAQKSPLAVEEEPGDNTMFNQHRMVPIPQSSYNILRARRGVIRMLIVVVLTFALCNLPFHARKMWQYW